MTKQKKKANAPRKEYVDPEERARIIKELTEKGSLSEKENKRLVITTSSQANFIKTAESLGIAPGMLTYRILQLFCEEKRATKTNAEVLMKRIQGMSDELLKILELICKKKAFTTATILKIIPSLKRFGSERILTLRAFTDLNGVRPSSLNQFFIATFPKGKRKEMGEDAYEKEIREKMISPDQVNVFYNICYQIKDISPSTAITILPKARQLKLQHTQIINAFMKEGVSFGNKFIGNDNILGLINLWLSLPELTEKKKIARFIKRLSRKPVKQKKDFQFIIMSFKIEMGKGKGKSLDSFFDSIRSFFD